MGLTLKFPLWILALPCLMTGVLASATPVYPDDIPEPRPNAQTLEEKRRFTMQLMKTAPLPTHSPTTVPELADPMAMGRDTGLRVFEGSSVHYMDLLAKPVIEDDPTDFALPPEALRGIDILDDLTRLYLSYDGRAFDSSVLKVEDAEVMDYRGTPTTTEGSPLSLTGFGEIVDDRLH